MITFIIKSSLSLLILYGLYWLLLRNEKLFVFNRYFLVFALVFSLVVPFIYIPINVHESDSFGKALIALDNNIQSVNLNQENIMQSNNSNALPGSGKSSFLSISLILFLIYFFGLFLFLIRFLRNVNQVIKTIRISEKIPFKGYRIVLTSDNPGPHSFFKNVFLNRIDYLEGKIDNEMLNHELEHIKQLHSIDIIIIEIVKILYWFNPICLLYERAIRINHEYLADHNVLRDSYNIKNYAEKLFNFILVKNIPLTSGSSHSFTKRRLLMLTKSRSGLFINRLRIAVTICVTVTVLLILGFKASDNQSSVPDASDSAISSVQNVVRGIVLKEDGKPLRLVTIVTPSGTGMQTGSDGRFAMINVQKDALLKFSCIGYKKQTIKADFTKEMVITMEKDPDYKGRVMTPDARYIHDGEYVTIKVTDDTMNQALLVIDGEVIDYKGEIKLKRDDIGGGKVLRGKEAVDKYGEKGKYGVVEIISQKRAEELGIKPPEPKPTRMYPEDYPTFQGKSHETFTDWVIKNLKYPDEAKKKKIQGRVAVNFNVEGDGSVGTVMCMGLPDPILKDAVIKVVQNSPKWEPAKNPEFNNPMPLQVSIKFALPDRVLKDDALNYVDEMPVYPGGEAALLKYINDNLKYPAKAKNNNIQGRVLVRFVINKEGTVEDPVIIKSSHPLLDAEALRLVNSMKGWKPGMIDGKPVNVWYIVPVTFALPSETANKEETLEGISPGLMSEYKNIVNKYKRELISDSLNMITATPKKNDRKEFFSKISSPDKERLATIFFQMNKEQQEEQIVSFYHIDPNPKIVPTKEQFESFKDQDIYGISINYKKVSNEVLNNYTNTDFSYVAVGKAMIDAAVYGKPVLGVHLMTNSYYQSFNDMANRGEIFIMGVSYKNGRLYAGMQNLERVDNK